MSDLWKVIHVWEPCEVGEQVSCRLTAAWSLSVFSTWLKPYGWAGPTLFPLLDHSEESLSQKEWEARLLQVSSPQELPPSTLASCSVFRILREESLRLPRDRGSGKLFLWSLASWPLPQSLTLS